jgi:membrane protein DedA with SNARE-associated domain
MKHFLISKLLGIPIIIWVLQLLYVAAALGVAIIIVFATGWNNQSSHLIFQILYVLAMVLINIFWRVKIKKLKPEWF